ncbi:uncharacterized protein BO80DRAFT_47182 [Aspergillus ibericus CBS 121593]|uniref:Uncharacterized protein n=1 Tax=Aspergillus ibericus CBS 121593 TaxID=1448316 RepID=A0A395H2S2_9EURO|nr:hypothetical protein BO80DRAFT_47182 [Aspergillus ibericus CBS 121593]RAL01920.1 hypothetical protein BO80DRAFT_47182 [Aspergillus ibericus CBS 121593]
MRNLVFRQWWVSLPLVHRVPSAVASEMKLRGVSGGRDLDVCESLWRPHRHGLTLVQDSGRLRLCGRHHGFHDPWRYDVKKRPITGEPRRPRRQTSMVCKRRGFDLVP